jgi:ribosome maturation protein Sdo1
MQNSTIRFIFKDGTLQLATAEDEGKYRIFTATLVANDMVEVFMNKVEEENGSLSQLAKVHACIKELARFTGHTFEEMKVIIKEKAGLVDPASKEVKSFSKCSKEELSEAIQMCIVVGNEIGYYF